MMPEILTESFCERCGTRYTFESAAPRKTRRLGQFKTLSKGMKNWVMSDDTSLDEAMAAARNDEDREVTSQQLDAFHATFNFCMTCRQYTCGNCWNAAEGRCLTCAPHLGHEILPAPFPDQAAFEPVRLDAEAWPEVDLSAAGAAGLNGNGNGHVPDAVDPWASAGAAGVDDVPEIDPAARLAFLSGETPAPVVRPEPAAPAAEAGWPAADWPTPSEAPGLDEILAARARMAETTPVGRVDAHSPAAAAEATEIGAAAAIEPVEAAAPEAPVRASRPVPAAEPLPPTVEGRAEAGAARTADLLRRFRPGQNIDAELAAYEAELDRAAAAAAAEPSLVAEALVEPTAPAAPAVVAPEPVAAAAEIAATPHLEPEPVAPAAAQAPAPEPIAAAAGAVEPAPEAPVAAPEPETIAASAPTPAPEQPVAPAAAPREDRIKQPTWEIFAPDATPGVGRPPAAPAQPPFAADPQWPVRPDQAESPAMALLANRVNRSPSDALWAASAQEVLARAPIAPPAGGAQATTAGVQPCSSCGLSLSATARFCRRCGTRQG